MKVEVTHLVYWGGKGIFVVTAYGDRSHVLATFPTRQDAVKWAARNGYAIVASPEHDPVAASCVA